MSVSVLEAVHIIYSITSSLIPCHEYYTVSQLCNNLSQIRKAHHRLLRTNGSSLVYLDPTPSKRHLQVPASSSKGGMGNCLSKDQIKDGDEVHSAIIATKVESSTTEAVPQAIPSSIPHANERSNTYQVTLDGSIHFFDTVRQLSEATELLAPLKAVCGVIVKALETTRVCVS